MVDTGETVALLGPSGSGKSTLLRLVLGLLAPDSGQILLRGEVVTDGRKLCVPPEERGLSMVFQSLALWPHLTVEKNLRFVLRPRRLGRAEEHHRIEEMLAKVGLSALSQRYPGELSGGEQQRVAIARALVVEPSVLLLDEPLSGLDEALRQEMLGLLQELVSERQISTVYVTHRLGDLEVLRARVLPWLTEA